MKGSQGGGVTQPDVPGAEPHGQVLGFREIT